MVKTWIIDEKKINSIPQKPQKMDFCQKIDAICRIKKITRSKLARLSGLNSTLQKAYESNREMLPNSTWMLLDNIGVRETWWTEGDGEIFEPKPELRGVTKPGQAGDGQSVDLDALRIIDIGHPDYLLLHKKALAELEKTLAQYRLTQDKNETKYLEVVDAMVELQKSYQELEKAYRNLMKVKGDKEA